MEQSAIINRLLAIIAPDVLNDWEVEEQADAISACPSHLHDEILRQFQAIWPVSHALSALFLHHVPKALTCLTPRQLNDWTNALLDVYEKSGLHEAGTFMADVEKNFLCRLRGENGVSFEEASPRLRLFVQALAGPLLELDLAPAITAATDTTTIFLPREITICKESQCNFLLYKLTASCLWAQAAGTTYNWSLPPESPLATELMARHNTRINEALPPLVSFFNLFPAADLARDLFMLAETYRLLAGLRRELPGLIHDAGGVYPILLRQRPLIKTATPQSRLLEHLKRWLCNEQHPPTATAIDAVLPRAKALLLPLAQPGAATDDAARCTARLYRLAADLAGPYQPTEALIFQGELRPAEAQTAQQRNRAEERQKFITALAKILPEAVTGTADGQAPPPQPPPAQQADSALLMPPAEKTHSEAPAPQLDAALKLITINTQSLELPEDLQRLSHRIAADLGQVPPEYISAAAGFAGSGFAGMANGNADAEVKEAPLSPLTYDEWDFRRNGFRKNWCVLHEKELLPTKGSFVEQVEQKYRGVLVRLRRQFEMMRLQERFMRRQRDGDDLDMDAIVESLADARAGLAPSERLFIRLQRDERSIAALFLVDMSSSTEGWVSTAIKEALILMCEALSVLGDSYGIYGFSGMRRLRSEIYHVKHLDEPYNDLIRSKIAAIRPQEYTRMGPPIRHATRLLAKADAKVRLLITLSDGKPEDYDDYKGEYAIEDTRHALIEAKATGIHPFCITIDREAHDYIAHMYGEVNYICVDDVRHLPNRMPAIYRALTT